MRQAFKRWLIKCAAGTTLAVGGAIFVLPLVTGDAPAPLVSLGIAVASADEPPPVVPAPNSQAIPTPLPPGETPQTYTVNSIPIVGEQPIIVDQVILPGSVQVEPLATIGFQASEPPHKSPPAAILGIVPAELPTSSGKTIPQSFQPVPDHRPVSPVGLQIEFPRGQATAPRKAFVDLSAAPCFAHSSDYSWIAGRVEYSNIQKEWRLRYASVDELDRYGGRVTLIENQHLQYLKDGMYVQVRGHLVNPDHSKKEPAFYRIEWFQRIDNPNQVLQSSPGVNPGPTTPNGSSNPSVPSVIPASTKTPTPDSNLTLPPIPLNPIPSSTNLDPLPLPPSPK